MNTKMKERITISIVGLVVVVSVVLFFFPNVIGSHNYSYSELALKKEQVVDNNIQLKENERNILSKREELETIRERESGVSLEAAKLKKSINEEDFVLDMPSFLIAMEQRADSDKVKLNIDYASIKTNEGAIAPVQEPGAEVNPGENRDPENPSKQGFTGLVEEIKSESEDPNANPENSEPENSENSKENSEDSKVKPENSKQEPGAPKEESELAFSQSEIESGTIQVEGFKTTVIPVSIEGSYSNVRNYIKYLDEIGLIKPSSVYLVSEEKLIKGKVILNVIHGEVFE